MEIVEVIVGLGSSMGDRKAYLDGALQSIREISTNLRVSTYIESEPIGGVATQPFFNAVCVFETDLPADELLVKLQGIEAKFGRTRTQRWEDRTLDLDILYYGDETIDTPDLQVPHPEIQNRDFVMDPILELFPDFIFKK